MRPSTAAVAALILVAAGCGGGNTTPPDVTPDPQATSVRDGRFELVFTVDRTTLRPGDAITGTAELWLRGPGSGALSGPGQLFGFEFAEVGGSHRLVAPVMDTDCSPHQMGSDAPLTSTIVKSGVAVDDFSRTFLEGRPVHLPAGTWDITAIAWFHEGRECGGLLREVRATIRVVVNG